MGLTEARKVTLKAYCKLDDLSPGDEALLERFYIGAVEKLAKSGISQPAEGTPRAAQFDTLVDAIVCDNWDNRGTQQEISMPENPTFRQSLNQMKQTEPVSRLDTGTGA